MDARIALMGQTPQLENPLNNLAKAYQIKQAQREMAAADRSLAKENALNSAWRESGGDLNVLREKLVQGGMGSLVPDVAQSFAKTREMGGKASQEETKAILDRMDLSRRNLEGVTTPQEFMQWHMANHSDPVLGGYLAQRGITAESSMGQINQALQTPDGFQQLLNQSKTGLEKSMEKVYQQQNLGDRVVTKALPKYGTGPVTTVSEELVGRSPNVSPSTRGEITDYQRQKLELEKGRLDVAKKEQERKQSTMVDLPPKVRQAREAAFPKSTLAVKDFTEKSNTLIKDLETLRDGGGLSGMTGLIFGRTPNARPESRKARALFDKIIARGSFQELANMRTSSPTGGALGQVSDFENKKLEKVFGGLDTTMDTPDFKEAINQVIEELKASQARTQEAYDMDYEYRQNDDSDIVDEGWTDL